MPGMSTPPPTTARGLVLVVDDHADTRALYEEVLRAAGYQTLAAASGEQALALTEGVRVEAAVIDVGLPGMNGFELAARLSARGRRPPLLAVTGRVPEGEAEETAFDAYLLKPCLPEKLIAAVIELAARRG
jgi:CheY-like chemotaxis protein